MRTGKAGTNRYPQELVCLAQPVGRVIRQAFSKVPYLSMQGCDECACSQHCGAPGPAFIGWVRAWPFGLNEDEARDACVLHKPPVMVGNLELRTRM